MGEVVFLCFKIFFLIFKAEKHMGKVRYTMPNEYRKRDILPIQKNMKSNIIVFISVRIDKIV
ncbi:hypothetical protein PUN28_020829 [Cardiocondyla obscurior]|uniref:Uncharacterized protein n=1 Tax=Cardiocondyla obscurior TaxID=286306 RepID=A0AAW2E9C8_9HYME